LIESKEIRKMALAAKKTVPVKKNAAPEVAPKPVAPAQKAPVPFAVPAPASKPAFNADLMQKIVDATYGENGALLLPSADIDAINATHPEFIEVHPDVQADGTRFVRATQMGSDFVYPPMVGEVGEPVQETVNPFATPVVTQNVAPVPPLPEKKSKPTVTGISIQKGIALPPRTSHVPRRGETYPFSTMESGDSFFIPATAERPKPATAYSSTVTSATNRYAEKTGRKIVNRRGKEVDELKPTRQFVIRPWVEPDGTVGARVWRVDGLNA
jgi:hypothetical protein